MAGKKKKQVKDELCRLDSVLDKFNKATGSVCEITLLNSGSQIKTIPVIPSGILSLDYILGVGGFPHGRIIEVYGLESSGKTTVTLHALASCQKNGGIGAFVDAEHALDIKYASNLGVDVNKLLFIQPDSGEQALNSVEQLAKLLSHGDMIVVDSVAALVPKAEIDGEVGDTHMGLQARMMSQALRKLATVVSNSGVTVIFINQIRNKIGVIYGSNETTTGGNALKFYSTQRVEVRRGTLVKQSDEVVGCEVRLKVVKNKVAPPLREAKPEMRYGQGIVRALEVLNYSVHFGFLEKKGAWYYYQGQALGQGVERAYTALSENSELLNYLEVEVLKNLFPTR